MAKSPENNSHDSGDESHRDSNRSGQDREHSRFTRLLKTASQGSPDVDAAFLEKLEQESTQAFLASHKVHTDLDSHQADRIKLKEHRQRETTSTNMPHKRTIMTTTIVTRALAAMLAGVIAWFGWSLMRPNDDTLGAALDRTAASSLQLQLTQANLTYDVFAIPGKIRLNSAATQYQIGNNEKTWLIDESVNRAQTGPPRHFDEEGKLNLLSLLGDIPAHEFSAIRNLKPAGEAVSFNGFECRRYETPVNCGYGRCIVVAHVEIQSGLLRQLELLPPDNLADRGVARLNLVQYGEPLDENLFAISDKLTPAGRVGKIAGYQGLVSLRPVMHRRWSLASQNMQLEVGDQLRTGPHGANAVDLQLKDQANVLVGPGSIVEMVAADSVRLVSGEMRVKVPEGGSVSLNGPGNETVEAKETAVYRVIVKDGKQILSRLENTPRWIGGFEGTSNYDPTGSLIATIDGRNVPLTVGYHKVSVDIRDQIARTEIEQSFVNHTDSQLEGVFYFPLPQDASISGFGMWINGELVEADVVEKQRALEIYETILREKRDPGLLEWTGGNIFKARVFPIFGNSEKRIKITYTQVLPRRGNRYVYQYGLQSEMLRQNPLRDLSISLKINSAVELANVNCPTHATRDSQTANSAVIEFSAQEYTPERDFEVTVDVQDGAPPVVVTPHRRGDDGYFMLQLTPPASSGGWQSEDPRGLTAEGEPLQILIIADTSASMNENARSQQTNFVTALLSLLSPEDRVNVVAADVEPVWQYDDWHPAGQQTADESRDWLAARDSLGWTDLERTFESVLPKVGKNTQVVYVGDGMVSTYVADGVEFANRLKRMFGDNQSTLHAISVGSSYETVVLKGIGSLGGGSLRQVSGSRTPESIAADLLSEIARPVLRDLKVEFDGLRVARVYPESLPNLSDGQQQILLGRYLPQGNDQQGTVRISGMLADKPVSWSAPLKLTAAESGNSFIPRLWARMHLDYLLNQGSSQAIQDQIIRLSEEFHIITPYTSLLVLESDEDRERFGVKRRFGMRDGERFFADGRDNANYELLQQQMKLAGNWRIGLQMQLLRYFATLGRAPLSASVQQGQQADWSTRFSGSYRGYGIGGGGGGFGGGSQFGGYAGSAFDVSKKDMFYFEDSDSKGLPMSGRESFESIRPSRLNLFERDDRRAFNKQRQIRQNWGSDAKEAIVGLDAISSFDGDQLFDFEQSEGFRNQLGYQEEMSQARYGRRPVGGVIVSGEINGRYESNMFLPARTKRPYGYPPPSQIANLFPGFSDFEKFADKPPADWPEAVRTLAQRVMRNGALSQIDGGFAVEETTKFYDDRRGNEYSRSNERTLYSPTAWLRQKSDSGNQTIVDWLAGSIRSVVLGGYELGRRRVATPTDKQINPFTGHHEAFERLVKTHESWTARLEDKDDRRDLRRRGAQNDDQKLLILTSDTGQTKEILIDTRRNIVLSVVDKDREGKTTLTRSFRDFVNIGGIWWALNRETKNADGYVQRETMVSVRQLDQPKFDAALVRHTPEADRVLFIEDDPRRTLRSATQSIADRRATIADHVLRLDWFMSQQRWPKAWTELETIARMAGARKGLAWLQLETQFASRKFEEMRQLLTKLAEETTAMPDANSDNQFFLATRLQNKFHQLQVGERLDLHRLLKSAFTNSLIPAIGSRHWDESLSSYLEQSSERVAALKIRQQLAQKYPYDVSIQKQYINGLFQQGQRGDAFEWLERVISRGPNPENKEFANPNASRWLDSEYTDLIRFKLKRLSEDGRYQEMLPICEELIAAENEKQLDQSVYDYFVAALVQTDQVEKVDQLIADWLSEAKTSKRDQPNVSRPAGERSKRARIRVALQYALGDNQNSSRTLEPKWVEPLATLVRDTSGNESPHEFARTVLNHHRFQKLDINSTIRRELMERLEKELDSLSPAMISFYYRFGSSQVADKAQWQQLAERLQRRWESVLEKLRIAITNLDAESTAENRRTKTQLESDAQSLGNTLESIYANVGAVERLKFLRQRIELATSENQRTVAANSLFNALLSTTWTVEIENETFDLLAQLIGSELTAKPRGRLSRVNALYLWTAAMNRGRRALAIDSIKDADEMVPAELVDKQKKAVEDAAAEFIAMLAQKETDDATPDWWKKWLQIERHYYEVRQKQNYDEVQATCREILGDQPRIFVPDVDDQDAVAAATLDAALQQRSLKMLLFLGSMGKATDEQREWMGRYIDRGLKISVDDVTLYEKETSEEPKTDEEKRAAEYRLDLRKNFIDEAVTQAASDWKMTKYQWMITTDQTDELISTLQSWAAVDDGVKTWRHALALLQAERGEIESAIKHFETIENTGELLAGDYRTLANWYLVMDRRDDYERAKLESLNATQEWELRNYISQATSHVQNTSGVPEDLDENVFIAIRSLMARARNVHSHDWSVRQLYRATRDFRVLAALADSIVGHSARGIYPQLRAWNETVEEIRDEATVDSILERIDELRKTKQTTTDLRALDLLESIIERRASKLENQPGPHIVRAVEALNRAFARDWEAGERVLMAQLLLILGNVENNELRTTQLAQLDDLLAAEPDPANEFGFSNRLHIAHARAQLIAQYGERQRAIDDLTRELNDYIKATGEPFPQDVLAALASLVEFHKQLRQCAAAEKLLQRFLPVATESQRGWLNTNLNELYLYALDNEGLVSLGSGKAIYANLHDYLLSQLNESVSEERRYQAINFICRFFDTACREHINEAKSDLRKFAFEQIPVELKKITNRYGDTVRQVASKLHDHLGAVDCVRFYVERYEQQPPRVRRNNALDLNYVGNWVRDNASLPAELDERLLTIVVDHLKRELQTMESQNLYLYRKNYHDFWAKHAATYLETANEVWRQNRDSGAHAAFISEYVYHGLENRDRAIEILLDAYQRELLEDNYQSQLVTYLQSRDRFDESIEILVQLIESHPNNVDYYVRLMNAYYKTNQKENLQTTWESADKNFNIKRFDSRQLEALANGCINTGLYQAATEYLDRLIEAHPKGQPDGAATFSRLNQQLSRAHIELGNLQPALDAANAAIVSWGANVDSRSDALASLTAVINAVEAGKFESDLDGLVELADKQAAETGQFNYLLRKAIGDAYQQNGQFKRAITQLQLAVELQPNDPEIHNALIACYDGAKDESGAVLQLFELTRLNRRDVDLYKRLAERLADSQFRESYPGGTERAYTSIVEMLPAESEGHAALAEIRQSQNRWDAAARHWNRVAEIRAKEPTGLVKLCEAQIHLGQWGEAERTLQQLKAKTWPERFNDVENQIQKLGKLINNRSKS